MAGDDCDKITFPYPKGLGTVATFKGWIRALATRPRGCAGPQEVSLVRALMSPWMIRKKLLPPTPQRPPGSPGSPSPYVPGSISLGQGCIYLVAQPRGTESGNHEPWCWHPTSTAMHPVCAFLLRTEMCVAEEHWVLRIWDGVLERKHPPGPRLFSLTRVGQPSATGLGRREWAISPEGEALSQSQTPSLEACFSCRGLATAATTGQKTLDVLPDMPPRQQEHWKLQIVMGGGSHPGGIFPLRRGRGAGHLPGSTHMKEQC